MDFRRATALLGDGQTGETDGAATAFGPLLRRLRMAAGLSQERLAERARISTEAVGSLERGSRTAPQPQTLTLLIDALNVDGPDRELLERAAVRPSTPRRRQLRSDLAGVASPLRLPASLTSFVGREHDCARLVAATAEHRLVSLVGPGGVGKSRLAVEVARASAERFRDGAVLVELAPIATPTSVIPAFANALGIADEGSVQLLDRVVAVARTRRQLIVVDNCEHVLDAVAAAVHAILTACPDVRVVATSREPLRIAGESILRLGPLAPAAAVALFIDRAKAVAPALAFGPEDVQLAESICRRVDGIPLAIELSASRTDMLELATIFKRLRERFQLLSAGTRAALPHHRTLRALVDWSHDLLDPDEVVVFRRLGSFAGGCRLDDAERVLAFDGVASDAVLDVLARLHDKSLLDVDRGEPPRFTMLQTIHDYARERLAAAGECDGLDIRCAMHYLDIAVAAGPALRGAAQNDAIARLSADIDNIRAALAVGCREATAREAGLRALGALSFYWIRTGSLTEASGWIEAFGDDPSDSPEGIAWRGVAGAFIELNRHRFAEGRAFAARAHQAVATCDDRWLAIYAAIAECSARSALGEDASAEIARAYDRAVQAGEAWLTAAAAFERGQAAMVRGELVPAELHFAEALDRSRNVGDEFMVHSAALYLGRTLSERDPARAARLIGETIDWLRPGALFGRAACIEALVSIGLGVGRVEDAARMFGIACALRSVAGAPPTQALAERLRARANGLPLDGAVNEGTGLSPERAGDTVRSFVAALA